MNRWRWMGGLVTAALIASPAAALATGLGVELWTDRGDRAIYHAGERMDLHVRTSQDAFLLVYEIDTEGMVRVLYPYRGSRGYVDGGRTYDLPPAEMNADLIVEPTVGQSYIVAIASAEPFNELPWYLQPYDAQAQPVGYEPDRDDDDGITAEGRIVGDPFVAMERIRRRVLNDPDDERGFGTEYTTYYVHDQVRYPRYVCYDCHRPGRWAWWAGFDPYYTTCPDFEVRTNGYWGWGPGYWGGSVPYYWYVPRADAPRRYTVAYPRGRNYFSSWAGWRRWTAMWGDRIVRHKSLAPAGYVSPTQWRDRVARGGAVGSPPGFLVADHRGAMRPVVGRGYEDKPREPDDRRDPGLGDRDPAGRAPVGHSNDAGFRRPVDRSPAREAPRTSEDEPDRIGRGGGRGDRPAPRIETPPREERPGRGEGERSPRYEPPSRDDRGGRESSPKEQAGERQKPREERPREERPREERRRDEPSRDGKRDAPSRSSKDDSSGDERSRRGGRGKGGS
jgi:hypothetical protein